MLRRLFKALAAFSLVLCIVLCGSDLRSLLGIYDWLYFSWPTSRASQTQILYLNFRSCHGEITITSGSRPLGQYDLPKLFEWHNSHGEGGSTVYRPSTRLGFGYEHRMSISPPFSITFPHWFLIMIVGLPPVLWLALFLRTRKRRHPGMCPACGYDLRATLQRCPECGAMPGKTPSIS